MTFGVASGPCLSAILVTAAHCVAEKGEFLAADLGGSQFRAHQVKVSDDGKQSSQLESKFYPPPKEVIQGNRAEVGPVGPSVAVLCLGRCPLATA